jgi:oligopeptide/dipeptide ABC transporter ATP-binding protein
MAALALPYGKPDRIDSGLLQSLPSLHHGRDRLPSIKGTVPRLTALPPGCPFHPRCPFAKPGLCDTGAPPETTTLPDGRHVIEVRATDWPGNVGVRAIPVLVDTRAPRVQSLRIERVGVERASRAPGRAGTRPARALLTVSDVSASRIAVELTNSATGRVIRRTVRTRGTARRVIPLGSIPGGRYLARIRASDSAGHVRTTTRVVRLRP